VQGKDAKRKTKTTGTVPFVFVELLTVVSTERKGVNSRYTPGWKKGINSEEQTEVMVESLEK